MGAQRANVSDGWLIDGEAAEDVAYAALASDRVWNAFSIADLEPPFRVFTRIAVARKAGMNPAAACLIFRGPAFSMIVPHGDPAGVAAILTAGESPSPTGVMVQREHLPGVEQRYDFPDGRRRMVRMAVDAACARPEPPVSGLERLDATQLDDVVELYGAFPENHFASIQLEHGVFFGVRQGGRLVAIGGTHVVAPRFGIAALGGIFTLPEARRRGYAGAITSALITDLLGRGGRDIVLTVHAANTSARRVYQRLGFREHCTYETGEAIARRQG